MKMNKEFLWQRFPIWKEEKKNRPLKKKKLLKVFLFEKWTMFQSYILSLLNFIDILYIYNSFSLPLIQQKIFVKCLKAFSKINNKRKNSILDERFCQFFSLSVESEINHPFMI